MAGHGQKTAAHQAGPEGVFPRKELHGRRESKIEYLQLAGIGRHGHHVRPTAWDLGQDHRQADDRADDVQTHLRDVGPDDRGHAAFECVKQRQTDDQDDGGCLARCPGRSEMTSEMANTRTPSASARVTRKMAAVKRRMRSPKRRRINS